MDIPVVKQRRIALCQLRGNIAQLHIGDQPDLLYKIEQQVGIGKVEPRRAICVLLIDVHIIVQNAVKPQIGKADFLLCAAQLRLHRADESIVRIADIDHLPPAWPDRRAGGLLGKLHALAHEHRRVSRRQRRTVRILQQLLQPVGDVLLRRGAFLAALLRLLPEFARCTAVCLFEKVDKRVIALEAVAVCGFGDGQTALQVGCRVRQPQLHQVFGKGLAEILFEQAGQIAFGYIELRRDLGQRDRLFPARMNGLQCGFQQLERVDALLRTGSLHRSKFPAQQRCQLDCLPHQLRLVGLLKIQPEYRCTAAAYLLRQCVLKTVARQIAGDLLFFLPSRPLQYLGRQRDLQQTGVLAAQYAVQRKRRDRVHLGGMNRTAFVRGRDRVLSMQTEKQRYACFHRDRNVLVVQYAEVDLFLRHCCLSCHSVLLVSA